MERYPLRHNKSQSHIPRRLNLLFFAAFLIFAALFIRLGYLQLYNGDMFKNMVQRTESTLSSGSVPRGMIYDSQGKIMVGNKAELAILYTRDKDSKISSQDIIETAKQLASLIDIPTNNLTTRDLKDYFIIKNKDLVNSRLSEKEKLLDGSKAYDAQLSKVSEEDIKFSEAELKIVALFSKMNSAYGLSTVTVKNQNVTQEEIARVSEQLGNLHGISIGTDWQRVYPQGDMLRSILGQVSTQQRGLPSERSKELIAKGYAMNDRVGISYLEEQYEDVLRGTKSMYNIVTDASDDILSNELLYEGQKGDNLVLTIDTEFNAKLDAIAEESLINMKDRGLNDRVYIVAMNPKNGDILGISGKKFGYNEETDSYNYDKVEDDTLGAINSSYGMGSSVKPAMVAIGYKEGVINLDNNVLIDEPLKFQASKEKSSVFNRTGQIPIDEVRALQQSSNIYMIKLAMMIGGQTTHEVNGPLLIKSNTIDIVREGFKEFGLGTKTGVDLPLESSGYSPESNQLVNVLDLSYGQFDLYTPLQMAQYVSTIANNGVRYSPRLVKQIRGTDNEGELGDVKATLKPNIMNVIDIAPEAMSRIHEGMRLVSHSDLGTARSTFMNYPITVGSKTGTTEAFYAGPIQYAANEPVTNGTYIGYAPFDNPEIAISVIVPYLNQNTFGLVSTEIAKKVYDAYFSMNEKTKNLIAPDSVVNTSSEESTTTTTAP